MVMFGLTRMAFRQTKAHLLFYSLPAKARLDEIAGLPSLIFSFATARACCACGNLT